MTTTKSYRLAETADALTIDQVEQLVTWKGYHNNDYFSQHTKDGQWLEMNLRGLLALYNASSDYDELEGWLEEVKGASKVYHAICRDPLNWAVTQ